MDAVAARDIRHELAWACANAGRYADAANVIAADVVESASVKGAPQVAVNSDALSWCVWKRRADAEALYQKDPQRMASIRPLIRDIERIANTSARELPPAQEVEDELAAIGPGAIASVFDEIGTSGTLAPTPVSACESSSASAAPRMPQF